MSIDRLQNAIEYMNIAIRRLDKDISLSLNPKTMSIDATKGEKTYTLSLHDWNTGITKERLEEVVLAVN